MQKEDRSKTTKGVLPITDSQFDSIISSNAIMVIYFWADWCAPCKKVSPVIDELASELSSDRVIFVKMDVDSNPRIPSRFHVRSIPTIMLFKDGQPVDQLIGSTSKSVIKSKILSHFAF